MLVLEIIRLQHSPGSSAKYNTPFDDKATIPCPSASFSSSIASPECLSQTSKTTMKNVTSHLFDLLPVIIFPQFIHRDTFEDRILPKPPQTTLKSAPRAAPLHVFWSELSRISTTTLSESGSLKKKTPFKPALRNSEFAEDEERFLDRSKTKAVVLSERVVFCRSDNHNIASAQMTDG